MYWFKDSEDLIICIEVIRGVFVEGIIGVKFVLIWLNVLWYNFVLLFEDFFFECLLKSYGGGWINGVGILLGLILVILMFDGFIIVKGELVVVKLGVIRVNWGEICEFMVS